MMRIGLRVAALIAILGWALAGRVAAPGASQGELRRPLPGHEKILVEMSADLDRMVRAGRLSVLDRYADGGRDHVLVGGPAEAVRAVRAAARGTARPVRDTILLRDRALEPSIDPGDVNLPSRGHVALVQFHGPVKPDWIARLNRIEGARVIGYVPHNAYMVWLDDGAALDRGGLPLQWRAVLRDTDRVSAGVRPESGMVDVTVQIANAGDHDAILRDLRDAAVADLMPPSRLGALTNVRVRLPEEEIAALAARPEVVWIEPFEAPRMHDERSALIAAGQVVDTRPAAPGYASWLASKGLADLGHVVVDVTDSGIDSGGTDVVHPGLRGRIAYARDWTTEGTTADCPGHGTHVAGTIAGAPVPGAALFDALGYLPGLGMNPSFRIGSSRIFRCSGVFDPTVSFTEIVSAAYDAGARVGNNSWGSRGPNYNTVTAEYDAIVRDANRDPIDGDQPFLPVFSAGNIGPLTLSVGWPATAKNVITVGATEGFRIEGSDGCGTGDLDADNANHLWLISSRGPTGDGRIKPDLVAPGTHIQSIASTARGYTGLGVCDPYHPPGQQVLNWSTGTSHAAPHVAAIAAMAAEIFAREFGADPSPAMIKAILINHARNLARSQTNVSHRPNMDQGWGRADLGAIVDATARVASDQEIVFQATGEEAVFAPVIPADPARPVVVTLVWTDAPGMAGAHSFVNDLDLSVTVDATTYLGNVFQTGASVPGGAPDARNNVEMVVVPAGSGHLSVRVFAANIAGDGLPSLPGETDQDFALYISNARHAASEGRIAIDPPRAVCGSSLTVRVADRHLAGFSAITARIAAGTDEETVLLTEAPASSGLFSGGIDVAAGAAVPADGVLQTDHDLPVLASYGRFDPQGGAPIQRAAQAPSICRGAAIRDLRVVRAGHRDVTLAWSTDLPTDTTVVYGPGSNRVLTFSDPTPVTDHTARLGGLAGCTFHTAVVRATDAAGRTTEIPTPFGFSTGPGGRHVIFRDDMEALATRWTHGPAAPGAVDDWELGFPSAAPVGWSGTRAWGTDLDGDYSIGADAVLISPPIDLRDAYRPRLTFRHVYDITGGATPPTPDDGAWIEISSDAGGAWTTMIPASGYPLFIDSDNPHRPENSKGWSGASPGWQTESIDLAPWSGSVVQVRFHLWQDATEGKPTRAGWYLDDVEVTAEATCFRGRLTLDAPSYGCSSPVSVHLYDTHLAASPTAVDTATVTAATTAGSIPVTLTETGAATAQFRGTLRLSPVSSPDALRVSEGETLTVLYDDADAGGGTPVTLTATAPVEDCTPPPAPTGLTARPNGRGGIQLTWNASPAPDVAGYRVHYDTDAPGPVYAGTGALQGVSPVRVEGGITTIDLDALAACAAHFVTVTAFDRFGNESAFATEVIAVPSRDLPCNRARITLQPETLGCRGTLAIVVQDANADPDAGRSGTVTVNATTSSGEGPVILNLVETGPASGDFRGTLQVSPDPGGGTLVVAEGDAVEISYLDADDGTGQARPLARSVVVGDCTGPAITEVKVGRRGGDRAVVTWTTDEPATTRLEYGIDPSLGRSVDESDLTTSHAVSLDALTPCGPIHYAVSSTDALGNSRRVDDGGLPFYFGGFREVTVFFDDFESDAGWTHASLSAKPAEWERGAPGGNGLTAPSAAFSGQSVWGTDLDGRYEEGADLVLVSPPIALRDGETATLTFQHWYDITSIIPPTGFDDGGFLEVSADGGATWRHIEPVGGYPDVIGQTPYISFGSGVYGGSTGGWVPARFHLDDDLGATIRIRFHLFQDEPDLHAPGMGWYLDDVRVTVSRPCHDAVVSLDQTVYACTDPSIGLRVGDRDGDLDPLIPDTLQAIVTSDTEPAGEPVQLTETGPSTGLFDGSVPLDTTDAPGVIAVSGLDGIVARYADPDDGTGAPRTRTAVARMSECTGPTLSDVTVHPLSPGAFRVTWSTDRIADSRVLFGTTPALGSSVIDASLVTQHDITVSGLQPCTRYFFTVASRDAGRTLVREDDTAPLRSIAMPGLLTLMDEGLDAPPAGWRHRGQGDGWTFSAGHAVHAVGGPYPRPPDEPNHDFVLESSPIPLAGIENPVLTLHHAFDFPRVFSGGDGGRVEGWNGAAWIPLTPAGGYPGLIKHEGTGTGDPAGGFNGTSSGPIVSTFDLAPLKRAAASVARLRFRTFVEAGIGPTGTGWRIDQVTVSATGACRAGRVAFGAAVASCADAAVSVTLHDDDLDLDPLSRDVAVVAARSSGGADVISVVLEETAPSGGAFTGTVPLDPGGGGGAIRAAAGDILTAEYQDADDGTGAAATVVTTIPVLGCVGPVPRDIALVPERDGVIRVRWRTDEPATSEVTLTPAGGGPALTGSDIRNVTGHEIRIRVPGACGSWIATIASENLDGLRATAGGPGGGLVVESVDRRIHFFDDMEGPDPGWASSGIGNEWQRGVPQGGPPTSFSGTRVFATDLTGHYDGGTNATLTTPLIDLTAAVAPRLTFWHWYDIFSSDPPNSYDDSSWVEVLPEGSSKPIWIEPLTGYPDTTDADAGAPLPQGTTVYSGTSIVWEKAVFDLSPWAGSRVRLRFRQWNDIVELIIHGVTGFGWYLDDVEVTSPRFCHPAPQITPADPIVLPQGASGTDRVVRGSGFREGTTISPGAGVRAENVRIVSAGEIRFDVEVDPRASLGPRDLVVMNPDGQVARAAGALTVRFAATRADINGSGRVDGTDLALLAAAFGTTEGLTGYLAAADLDSDGVVDGFDLALLAASFGVSF